MKTKTRVIILLAAMCAGTFVLAACDENLHTENAKRGYNVSVRYDSNGGKVSSADNTHVVDDYRYDDVLHANGGAGVKLFPPDDPVRKGDRLNVERAGYFLAGWYRERKERTNENGEPLDIYGRVCDQPRQVVVKVEKTDSSGNLYYEEVPKLDENGEPVIEYVSKADDVFGEGLTVSYSYAGLWNFKTDYLNAEILGDYEYEEGKYALTLYAAWVPMFTYEIYGNIAQYTCAACGAVYYVEKPSVCTAAVQNNEGGQTTCGGKSFTDDGVDWRPVASKSFNPLTNGTVALPVWEKKDSEGNSVPSGELNYGDFPKLDTSRYPLTFRAVYDTPEDAESGTGALENIHVKSEWDPETGTASGFYSRFYADFDEGIWYRIYSAQDLFQYANNLGSNAKICFDIMEDLDFSKANWPLRLATGSYSGHFRGNGKTISNVTVRAADSMFAGLFGKLEAGAIVENVKFEAVTFRLEGVSRQMGAMYGLFAGALSQNATITNVTVSGKVIVGSGVRVPGMRYDSDSGQYIPEPKTYDVGLLTGNFVTKGISLEKIELEAEEGRYARVKDKETGELEISDKPFAN